MLQRAMALQDIQTTRPALVAADVAGVDRQLLAETRALAENMYRLFQQFVASTPHGQQMVSPQSAFQPYPYIKVANADDTEDQTAHEKYTIDGKQFPTLAAMVAYVDKIATEICKTRRAVLRRLFTQGQ